MLVQDAIRARVGDAQGREESGRVRLPTSLKTEKAPVRTALFQRLAASRLYARGDRSGVLKTAQKRSGRSFRLDVRQRVIVKALMSRHAGRGTERGAALAAHVSYLGRSGAGVEGARPEFFDREADGIDGAVATRGWSADRHHFLFGHNHRPRSSNCPRGRARGYVSEERIRREPSGSDAGQLGLGMGGLTEFVRSARFGGVHVDPRAALG